MEQIKTISGDTPELIWEQIRRDFSADPELFEYSVIINQAEHSVSLDIDIDLGGGFEGGYAITRLASNLDRFDELHFSIHREDLLDGIVKIFGAQDVVLGYPEFDEEIVVKTNQPDRLKEIFSDSEVRQTICNLPQFTFHIGHHHSANTEVESAFLELKIDDGITDPDNLYQIYRAFMVILQKVELDEGSIMKHL